jgi:CCR4-NOT transcription complex subunit 1
VGFADSVQEPIQWAEVIRAFDTPNTIAAYQYSLSFFVSLCLIPDQNPVPPIAGVIPATPDSPIWENTSSLLSMLERLTSLAPDRFPILTRPNAASPSALTRIVDMPPQDSGWSKAARQQAKDIQAAGIWNTMGLILALVTVSGVAESGDAGEESGDLGRRAGDILEKARLLAPELVLIALERLPVSVFGGTSAE